MRFVGRSLRGVVDFVLVGGLALAGCSLSHPHYIAPDVHVGEPAFARSVEAHTLSSPVPGNRARKNGRCSHS